jgi:hypothetical protein
MFDLMFGLDLRGGSWWGVNCGVGRGGQGGFCGGGLFRCLIEKKKK